MYSITILKTDLCGEITLLNRLCDPCWKIFGPSSGVRTERSEACTRSDSRNFSTLTKRRLMTALL